MAQILNNKEDESIHFIQKLKYYVRVEHIIMVILGAILIASINNLFVLNNKILNVITIIKYDCWFYYDLFTLQPQLTSDKQNQTDEKNATVNMEQNCNTHNKIRSGMDMYKQKTFQKCHNYHTFCCNT